MAIPEAMAEESTASAIRAPEPPHTRGGKGAFGYFHGGPSCAKDSPIPIICREGPPDINGRETRQRKPYSARFPVPEKPAGRRIPGPWSDSSGVGHGNHGGTQYGLYKRPPFPYIPVRITRANALAVQRHYPFLPSHGRILYIPAALSSVEEAPRNRAGMSAFVSRHGQRTPSVPRAYPEKPRPMVLKGSQDSSSFQADRAPRFQEENPAAGYHRRMDIHALAVSVLTSPLPDPMEALAPHSMRPAVALLLEGLARKASSGDAAAARELREWLRLENDMTPPAPDSKVF